MPTRRRFLLGSSAALAWASTGFSRSVLAQAIAKPARILVGFPPGGGADIVARQLAERLRGSYAPAVVVENKSGARRPHCGGGGEERRQRRQRHPRQPQPDDHAVPAHLPEARLRPRSRPRACHVDLQLPGGARGRTRRSVGREIRRRSRAVGAGQSAAGVLWDVGDRLDAALRGRHVRARGQCRADARGLQGRRPGDDRSARRPAADDDLDAADDHGEPASREAARAGGHRGAALAAAAGRADVRGVGLRRTRNEGLVRRVPAGEGACRDRHAD